VSLAGHLGGLGGRDLGVALGSANTVLYVRGRGVILSEPSVVAIDPASGEVRAAGIEADEMLARQPGTLERSRPLEGGVARDSALMEQMLRCFVQRLLTSRFMHPRVVVCLTSGVTGSQARAAKAACLSAGAGEAHLIESPMAAAMGAGVPVGEPRGSMVVDIGAASTQIGVISRGELVDSGSLRVGGDDFDRALQAYTADWHGLLIASGTAEEVKIEVGSVAALPVEVRAKIRGRDGASGAPRAITLSSAEVRGALGGPVEAIATGVSETLDRIPRELVSDIMDRGITLAGGGSLLQGLEQRLRDECQMPFGLAESPLTCVAVGSGISLEEFEAIDRADKNPALRRRHV